MRSDDGLKSAVIITQAEAAIQYNDDPRTLAGLIGSWARLPVGNASLCILLFSAANLEQLSEIAQQLPIPEVRSVIQNRNHTHQNSALCRISIPDEHEIQRLLMLRQQQGTLALEEDPVTFPVGSHQRCCPCGSGQLDWIRFSAWIELPLAEWVGFLQCAI
jgi:hypothetical protein